MNESIYKRAQGYVSTDMDGETVMLGVERGAYFGIRGVGTVIWDLLESPQSVGALTARLCETHEIDEATCRADVERFVSELLNEGMIEEVKA